MNIYRNEKKKCMINIVDLKKKKMETEHRLK